MSDSHYRRFCLCVCLAGILGLLLLATEASAQPPGYRKVCTGTSCRLVPITTRPASVRRFKPLRRDGRRFVHSRSRPARFSSPRVGRFWRGR